MPKLAALRGKLWRSFHSLRISQLPAIWKDLFSKFGWDDVPDAMLEQYTNQRLLDGLMVEYFERCTKSEGRSKRSPALAMTSNEENIIRYACGYVPYKLFHQFKKQTTQKAAECAECLANMAYQGEGDLPTYAVKWIEQVNRGGLFQVTDATFALFLLIERKLRADFPNILAPNSQSLDKDTLVAKPLMMKTSNFSGPFFLLT